MGYEKESRYNDTKDGDEFSANNQRIIWARGLSNDEIVTFLNGKLMEARAKRTPTVEIIQELVHEIKYRFTPKTRKDA